MLSDVRFALRQLAKSPGFTAVAVVTLALGLGANTSMFSILNGYMLRPLSFVDSDQLDRIYRSTADKPEGLIAPADYLAFQPERRGYGEVAAYVPEEMSLSEPGLPAEMASGLRVSANLLAVFRVQPQLGRDFRAEEDLPGNHRVLLISHRYWQNRFGGRADVIGRTVRVDGQPHEIIGVLPASFFDWRYAVGLFDLYRPLALDDKESVERTSTWLRLVGRRSSNLSRAQAAGFIANFGRRLAADFPAANAASTWRAVPLNDAVMPKDAQRMLLMLIGLSGFVLLIACSNLAHLLLARSMARAREFAVRSALGATRAQLLRPVILESLLLAFAGGLGAILVALWTFDWIAVRSTTDHGDSVVLTLDWHILAWALAVSLVTALAFGLVPALFALRLDTNRTLKSGARGLTGSRGHQRFRHFLIVGQFALAMVLLAGAALFVRGLDELNRSRIGWESEHLVTGTILLPAATFPDEEKIAAFQRLALERLEALPGVQSASLSYTMPFFGLSETRRFLVAGRPTPEPGHEPAAAINGVSPRFFATVGTRLLSGRAFNAGDTRASAKVFVINQAMATGLFGGENPIGQRLARAGGKTIEWGEIVGVVGDVQSVLPNPGPATYQIYQPMAQEARPRNEIAVRAAGITPAALVENIRAAIAALNPDLPVRKLQPADTTVTRANYQMGVLASLLSWLAGLGLGLAALGIYGVIARAMAQRTTEFGIRLALGAQLEDLTRLVLGTGLKLALLGSAIGLLGAFGVARLLAAEFPAIHPNSVAVIVGATLLLLVVAILACWLPARRATKVNPMEALRSE